MRAHLICTRVSALAVAIGLAGVLFAGTGTAGPNAGGILLVHYNAGVSVPPEPTFVYGGLTDCENAVTMAPTGTDPTLWFVYAAFPPNAAPRLKVVTFGCDFNDNTVAVLWSATWPGATEIFFPDQASWPYSGSGVAVGFLGTLTSVVNEVYCFAGYGYQGETFGVVPHPDPGIGGTFADDGSPSHLDLIAGYGFLGFGVPGSQPDALCPAQQTTGACCRGLDGTCEIVPESACSRPGDQYRGDTVPCPPSGDCLDESGACCTVAVNGACEVLSLHACRTLGGLFIGYGEACAPSPCPLELGACCTGGVCTVTTLEGCDAPQGIWSYQERCVADFCLFGACCHPVTAICYVMRYIDCLETGNIWVGGSCDPNPCPQPAVCCDPWTGSCSILDQRTCEDNGLIFHPEWTSCEPDPCPQPALGACCNRQTGVCILLAQVPCESLGANWQYLGDGTDCDPNPCFVPTPGACCLSTGECVLVLVEECEGLNGRYLGDGIPCAPHSCEATPTEVHTWGQIKSMYR